MTNDRLDCYGSTLDDYRAEVELRGDGAWQPVLLYPADFQGEHTGLLDWEGVTELSVRPGDGGGKTREAPFELRDLRWVPGTRGELNARRKVRLPDAPVVDGRTPP